MKKLALLIIGLLSVIALLNFADFQAVTTALLSINIFLLIFACFLQFVTIYLINLQWKLIAGQMGERVPMARLFNINMAGTFVESITPAVKAGGEAVKVLMLRSELGFSTAKATALVGLQKTVSMFSFIFLCTLGMLWFLLTVGSNSFHLKILGGSLVFLLFCCLLLMAVMLFPQRFLDMILKLPISHVLRQRLESGTMVFQRSIEKATAKKKAFTGQLVLASAIWVLFAVKSYVIAYALQLDVDFIPLAVITFLTYMVAMVPLLPGGLGTFEGAMIFLLLAVGVPIHQGLAFALILRFVTFWFVFLVSALYLGAITILGLARGTSLKTSPKI